VRWERTLCLLAFDRFEGGPGERDDPDEQDAEGDVEGEQPTESHEAVFDD